MRLALFFLLLSPMIWAKLSVVDGTAASVNKQLITIQDAYFYRGLMRFKEGHGNLFQKEEGEELKRTVQKIALELMVQAEMKSFKLDGAGRSEAEKLIEAQKAKGRTPQWRELLRTYGKNEKTALDILTRSVEVEKFLQKKVETLTPIITEAEAEKYFRQNQTKYLGSGFETVKQDIVLELRKERMQRGLEEWVRSLKEKHAFSLLLS